MIENKATVKVIFQPRTCSWGHWRICKEHHHSTRTLLSHLRGWLQRRRRSGVCTGWGLHFQECIYQHPVCIGTSWWSSMPVWLKTLLQRGEFFFLILSHVIQKHVSVIHIDDQYIPTWRQIKGDQPGKTNILVIILQNFTLLNQLVTEIMMIYLPAKIVTWAMLNQLILFLSATCDLQHQQIVIYDNYSKFHESL